MLIKQWCGLAHSIHCIVLQLHSSDLIKYHVKAHQIVLECMYIYTYVLYNIMQTLPPYSLYSGRAVVWLAERGLEALYLLCVPQWEFPIGSSLLQTTSFGPRRPQSSSRNTYVYVYVPRWVHPLPLSAPVVATSVTNGAALPPRLEVAQLWSLKLHTPIVQPIVQPCCTVKLHQRLSMLLLVGDCKCRHDSQSSTGHPSNTQALIVHTVFVLDTAVTCTQTFDICTRAVECGEHGGCTNPVIVARQQITVSSHI